MRQLQVLFAILWAGILSGTTIRATDQWEFISNTSDGIGQTGSDNFVEMVTVGRDNVVYAYGNFTSVTDEEAPYFAKWNGSSWQALSDLRDNDIGGYSHIDVLLTDSGGNIYTDYIKLGMGDSFRPAVWYGSAWGSVGNANLHEGGLKCMILDSGDNLYVGGIDMSPSDSEASGDLLKWNGSEWAIMADTDGRINALALDSKENLYIVGNFTKIGEETFNRIAKWDGTKWSALGSGADARIETIIVGKDDVVYVQGAYSQIGGVVTGKPAKWNGNSWSEFSMQTIEDITLHAVDGEGNLLFLKENSDSADLIVKYDGSSWQQVVTADISGEVKNIYYDDGYLYVVGAFENIDGNDARFLARYNYLNHIGFSADDHGSLEGDTAQLVADGGASAGVTAVPDAGSTFDHWTMNGEYYSSENPLVIENITTNMTLKANFSTQTCQVIFSTTDGGYLEGDTEQQVVYKGACTTITAIASDGYSFDTWTLDGHYYSGNNPLTVASVLRNMDLVAVFQQDGSSGGGGSPTEDDGDGDFEDVNALLNTTLYETFSIPYAERLAPFFRSTKGNRVYAVIDGKKVTARIVKQSDALITAMLRKGRTGTYQLFLENRTSKASMTVTTNLNIRAPRITLIQFDGDNMCTIQGNCFGDKKPRVYLTKDGKKLRCKVTQASSDLIICRLPNNYIINYEYVLNVKNKVGTGTYLLEAR